MRVWNCGWGGRQNRKNQGQMIRRKHALIYSLFTSITTTYLLDCTRAWPARCPPTYGIASGTQTPKLWTWLSRQQRQLLISKSLHLEFKLIKNIRKSEWLTECNAARCKRTNHDPRTGWQAEGLYRMNLTESEVSRCLAIEQRLPEIEYIYNPHPWKKEASSNK